MRGLSLRWGLGWIRGGSGSDGGFDQQLFRVTDDAGLAATAGPRFARAGAAALVVAREIRSDCAIARELHP